MPAETYYIVKEDSIYSTPWYDIKIQYAQAYDAYNVAISRPPERGEDPMIIERNARDQFISDCNAIAIYYNSIKDTCPIPSTVNGKRTYNDGRDNFVLLKYLSNLRTSFFFLFPTPEVCPNFKHPQGWIFVSITEFLRDLNLFFLFECSLRKQNIFFVVLF